MLIIASLVTCIELIFKAWFPVLDRSLGIFIPLIVTNCAIVARAEVFASRNRRSELRGRRRHGARHLLLIAIGVPRTDRSGPLLGTDMLFGGDPAGIGWSTVAG